MKVCAAYMPDLIIAAIVVIFAVIGYKKGLVRSVVGMLSLVASVVLAWMLRPLAADLFDSMGVKLYLSERIQNSISGSLTEMTGNTQNLPYLMRGAVESGQRELAGGIADMAAASVVSIAAFIAVLIAARLIIWVAVRLLNLAVELPVIGLFNRAAGTALGAFEGIMIVYLLLAVIYAAAPLKNSFNMEQRIEDSLIAKTMYTNNPVVNLIGYRTADANTENIGNGE